MAMSREVRDAKINAMSVEDLRSALSDIHSILYLVDEDTLAEKEISGADFIESVSTTFYEHGLNPGKLDGEDGECEHPDHRRDEVQGVTFCMDCGEELERDSTDGVA